MNENKYDVILVGAGPSNVFCAYKLITEKPDLKILMFEKGKPIENRVCPKREGGVCVNCPVCSITSGFSGAGAFSDGKFTLASSETGGNFSELVGDEVVKELLKEVDNIYLSFGATTELHGVDNPDKIAEIRKKAIQANMRLIDSPVRHLGTDGAFEIYRALQDYLMEHGVQIAFSTTVTDILTQSGHCSVEAIGVRAEGGRCYYADKIVVGAGREGASWFKGVCEKHGVDNSPGVVDVGVRVECRNEVMEELNKALYEAKLVYYTKTYADKVRTFCQNPGGEVALENYNLPDGTHLKTVNGHSYKEQEKKTDNTNFALLVSKKFTEPFNDPLGYGTTIAKLANMMAGGNVLVQTYGDIKRGRRSTEERIKHGNVVPTLKDAVAGDLTNVIPGRIMTDIIEMIEAMDSIVPGIANDETLLYGVEVKFYSNKVIVDENCETSVKGLYAIGDSSSWSRGLSIASAMGLYVGRHLAE